MLPPSPLNFFWICTSSFVHLYVTLYISICNNGSGSTFCRFTRCQSSCRKNATRAIHATCRSISTSLDVLVFIWFITRTFLYLYCVIIYCCIHVFDNRAVPVMRCQWWHSACIHYCFIIIQVVLCLGFNVANLSEEYGGNFFWELCIFRSHWIIKPWSC